MTGHCYIGSSRISLKQRWDKHRWNLNSNAHRNKFLQHHWNKYGRDNFEFVIIEEVPFDQNVIEREQFYLDNAIKNVGRRRVYNGLSNIGKFPLTVLQTTAREYIIIDPRNNRYDIADLNEFCIKHGLLASSMGNVARTGPNSHQRTNHGWLCYYKNEFTEEKLKDDIKWRDEYMNVKKLMHYVIVDPQDKLHESDNLKAFCRQHKLTFVCMCKTLHRDKGPLWLHKGGWMAYYKDQFTPERLEVDRKMIEERLVEHCVTSPDGTQYKFRNVPKFAKTHGLKYSWLQSLITRKAKTSRSGWTAEY